MSRERIYGFTLTGVFVGERHRPVARFQCVDCPRTIDITLPTGRGTNGQEAVKSAKAKGWDAHHIDARIARCPICRARKQDNDPNSELKKAQAKMVQVVKPPAPPAAVPMREPTADQRAMIRALIEKHFDEDDGVYLEGASDETIANEAKVPRIVVERLREAAYGPIRVSSQQLLFRREIANVRAKVSDTEQAANSLFETIKTDLNGLKAQLADLESRNERTAA